MDKKIIWSRLAANDIEAIWDFIARDSENCASDVATEIHNAIGRLPQHPRMGRRIPELGEDALREVIVPPYRILYRVEEHAVIIAGILHGARDLQTFLQDRRI